MENLAFYKMFFMQHTLLRAKIIFLKSEMGWKESKMQFYSWKLSLENETEEKNYRLINHSFITFNS